MPEIAQYLLPWFELHGRKNLPWQQQVSPYRVWLSEIMLQQTQVVTVIPYYEKFLNAFPTVQHLAAAKLDQVLALWAGLGYYARARNLHKTARIVCDEFAGEFPQTLETLQELPGIGRSTAGAIASLAMGQAAGILDGNVKRVLCRVFQVEGWPGSTQTQKQLWSIVEQQTPDNNTAFYNQAMMDLGSIICHRTRPACNQCPLSAICKSYRTGSQAQFPHKKPKQARKLKHCWLLLHRNEHNQVMLEKRPPQGIWGGLWSLPEIEQLDRLNDWQIKKIGQSYPVARLQEKIRLHKFTHFDLSMSLAEITFSRSASINANGYVQEDNGFCWMNVSETDQVGLPTPIRIIVEESLKPA